MKLIRSLKNKFRSKSGETMTETLVSLLIIVPAMVMLAGAIVTAANINFQSRDSKATELPALTKTSGTAGTLTISAVTGDIPDSTASINWCIEDESIYYYFR